MKILETYTKKLTDLDLTEEQVQKVLIIMREIALDAIHDNRVKDWAMGACSTTE